MKSCGFLQGEIIPRVWTRVRVRVGLRVEDRVGFRVKIELDFEVRLPRQAKTKQK